MNYGFVLVMIGTPLQLEMSNMPQMKNPLSTISSMISRIFYRRCQKRRLKRCMKKRTQRQRETLEQTMPRHGFRKGLRIMTFDKTKKMGEATNQPRKVRPNYRHDQSTEDSWRR